MNFLARSLNHLTRRHFRIKNLTNSLRALSVTPQFCQHTNFAVEDFTATKHVTKQEQEKCQEVFNKVNKQLAEHEEGRIFAIVHLCGKQFKITAGDIILVEGYWPPTIGDKIRLEKVLLAGSRDFTLIGTPMLEPGMVDVKATIIEKTLTHTKTHFKKKRRKQYLRINFQRSPNTMIRINSIEVKRAVDQGCPQPLGEKRIF